MHAWVCVLLNELKRAFEPLCVYNWRNLVLLDLRARLQKMIEETHLTKSCWESKPQRPIELNGIFRILFVSLSSAPVVVCWLEAHHRVITTHDPSKRCVVTARASEHVEQWMYKRHEFHLWQVKPRVLMVIFLSLDATGSPNIYVCETHATGVISD